MVVGCWSGFNDPWVWVEIEQWWWLAVGGSI